MFDKLKYFFKKLRESDETVKTRWLVGLSAAAMLVVVGLWLIYLNALTDKKPNTYEIKEQIGFWRIFKTGLKTVGSSLKEKIIYILSEAAKNKTIIIENGK